MIRRLAFALSLAASPAAAFDLAPTGGTEQARIESPAGSVRLPRMAWRQETAVPEIEGAIRRTAYTIPGQSLTTLQLLTPLRTQLEEAGYTQIFTCADAACGGFDFRFQLDLIPAPAMFVDLGNFRYLLMENSEMEPHAIALLASSTSTVGYLHVTEVSASLPAGTPETVTPTIPESNAPPPTGADGLIDSLRTNGHAVLPDLDFATGSSDLGPGSFPSLQALAAWLAENPGARVVLVGHTDSVGSLDANEALSRRRAQSVLERLTTTLGTNPNQLQADGAGALSPIASNLDDAGRAANRRVEVVLLSIQ